jgi:chemotaxis protein histidine kinase CheA/CheY-like chemotaxis protein
METRVKQWQNFQALGKVKVCIEQQVRDLASILENSLDKEQLVPFSAEECSQHVESLLRISGVLRMLECHEVALLVDEILGMLEDAVALDAEQNSQQITEIRQLAFVALSELPALVEGTIAGKIQHWHELSELFNKITTIRNKGLVFSSQTLLTKRSVNFRQVFSDNPEHLKALLEQQLKLYNRIKMQLQSDTNVIASVRELHTLFFNLEVMSRDFKLATLWGLCAAIAEALPEAGAHLDNPSIKLLCSFSTIIQMVSDKGIKALNQNIPEEITARILKALTGPHIETERMVAIKCWFGLDPNLAEAWHKRGQELLISYNRKDGIAKAIRLVMEQTTQLSDQLNDELANGSGTPEQVEKFGSALAVIQGLIATFGMKSLAKELIACTALPDSDSAPSSAAFTAWLDRCAQTLYRCELALQEHVEELERAVFVLRAGKHDSTALTGGKLNVVLEAIKNLEQVVIATNDYAEADWDIGKLQTVAGLLSSTGYALSAVSLARAADCCAVAANFVETKLVSGAFAATDSAFASAVNAFAHVIISTILYLEQISVGRTENCRRIEQECDAYLQILRPDYLPVVSGDDGEVRLDEFTIVPVQVEVVGPARADAIIPEQAEQIVSEQAEETSPEQTEATPTSSQTTAEPDEDEEIRAIFVEEAAELLTQINDCHAALGACMDDTEALTTLRRSYHTLKGSGRMVGAGAIGALAWRVENLLNNVISGGLQLTTPMLDALLEVRTRLSGLVEDFEAKLSSAFDSDSVAHDIGCVDAFLPDQPSTVVEVPVAAVAASVPCDVAQEVLQAPSDDALLVENYDIAQEISPSEPAAQEIIRSETPPLMLLTHQAPITNTEVLATEETASAPMTVDTPTDSFAEVLQVEFRRKVSLMRQYLDGSVDTDADGMTISSTSYLIPVHTLYGNCKVAELAQFGTVVGRLERLLQDHPYRRVSPVLQALLAGFCDLTEKVIANPGSDSRFALSAELQHQLDAFLIALDSVRSDMTPRTVVEVVDNSANNFLAVEDAEVADEAEAEVAEVADVETIDHDALVLAGFLQEARTINAHIANLYAAFQQDNAYDKSHATRLQEQFTLFEGAASVAQQPAIAPVCRELAHAYQQYVDGLYPINETVIILLDRCHGYIDSCMNILESGARVDAPAEDLPAELQLSIAQLIFMKNEAATRVAEEKVEDSLLAVFVEEASEILQELDSKIADWQQAPDDRSILDELLRLLHTLKGSAALVGESDLSDCAHRFETCVIDSGNSRRNRDKLFFAEVDRHLNALQVLFALYHTDESGRLARAPISEEELASLMRIEVVPPSVDDVVAATPIDEAIAADAQQETVSQLPAPNAAETSDILPARSRSASGSAPAGAAVDEHVRVPANLLKSLLNDADEISIARNRIEQTIADMQILMGDMEETLGRIESSMNSFEFYAKTRAGIRQGDNDRGKAQSDAGTVAAKDFDALEMDKYTELQQIVLSLLEDYNDVRDLKTNVSGKIRSMGTILDDQQRSTNKLQEGLVSSQMVPFAGVAPRLRRLVRQVSADLDKQVTIQFSNPDGKIDRSVLQALVNPIEHMIRNAVDHGIESTAERLASGKQGQGELHVKLYRQGASIMLDIVDDGRGINTAKVRQKALAQGLLAESDNVTEQELCQFILRAGFSTSDTVSHISGRGVGLDVVQDEISQIGGDIEILSRPGLGTTFRIRLPMTSSLNRALLFSVSGAEYVMLLNTIDGIILEKNDALMRCYGGDVPAFFSYGDKSYELAYLGSLLDEQAIPEFQGGSSGSSSLVLVSGNGKNLALHVDSVVGSRELVVKSLGAQFSSISVLTGGVILGDGRVVVVLDPRFLVENHVAKKLAPVSIERAAENSKAYAEFETGKTVMVVDDSITVRKVTSAILKRNGMNVILAKNGMEAVELLQTTKPDVMLLDIEMPKMDGFEVAAYVRRQEDGIRNLPIIMITSRIGDKHRMRAEEIGVNQYMCKPFQEVNLLEAIAEYN